MTRVPDFWTFILLDSESRMAFPFFNHLMSGLGLPDAWQGRIAMVLTGRVWLAGPMVMMGGGWSSTAVTSK